MRRLLLIGGLTLLLLGAVTGLAVAGLRLTWEEVPPPHGVAERSVPSLAGWGFCRSPPAQQSTCEVARRTTVMERSMR